jgi:chemotaxis protein CheC
MTDQAFSSLHLDILRELSNIGSGNAASALAKMIHTKIDMKVPQIRLISFDEIVQRLGGADTVAAGIYLSVSGDISCRLLFMLPIEAAKELTSLLMGFKDEGELFSEMESSALMEIGSIMCGTYMNAIAQMTNMHLKSSVPALGVDMASSIIDAILALYGEVSDHVLLMENEFVRDGQGVMGNFLLLPDPESLPKIFSALGVSF